VFPGAARHDAAMKKTGIALVLAALALAACSEQRPREFRNTGYSDRCADFMRLSFPKGEIVVNQATAQAATTESGDLGLMIIDVSGVRPNIPATGGFLERDVAARCRFQNGILTEFRWTRGPMRAAAP